MVKRRSRVSRCIDAAVYVAVRVAICVVQSLPRDACERFARRVAPLLADRVRIRRDVVRDNLRTAFPTMMPEDRRRTARKAKQRTGQGPDGAYPCPRSLQGYRPFPTSWGRKTPW